MQVSALVRPELLVEIEAFALVPEPATESAVVAGAVVDGAARPYPRSVGGAEPAE